MKQFLLFTLALLILLVAAITMTEQSSLHAMHSSPGTIGAYPSVGLQETARALSA